MKKQNVRTSILLVVTSAYLLIGAAIFSALEKKNETLERKELNLSEYEFIVKYNISPSDFELITKNIIHSRSYKAGIQWQFGGAFYFALTVITTIGYGHSTPKTIGGKLFCICYAVLGIPLNIVMFQSIGERFNIFLLYVLKKVKHCCRWKYSNVSQFELILVGAALCILVLVGGASAFQRFECWSFLDSLYFCFVTMSTIGFGDFVALQNQTTAALQTQPGYVTFCIVYIVCGLTVFAAALNQMVLKLLMLNTEDERKDQIEAKEQARHAPKIDGDILIANDESVERESSFTTNVDNNTLHPKIFANQAAQNFSLLAYNIQNNVISSQSHSTLKSPKITKPRCAKKKFNLSKLRYSATRRPCSSVRHLLTMQDPNGDLPIIYRNPNLNSTHIPQVHPTWLLKMVAIVYRHLCPQLFVSHHHANRV
ncbi:KCNK9 [Bugula neritina]|uniref:KCNK9 n=1 Tax=Bugula neritina TaxID=10212 RepID=A0A7J7KGZ7_BUGNE|nr:KCNK9 [Bugula neritina]